MKSAEIKSELVEIKTEVKEHKALLAEHSVVLKEHSVILAEHSVVLKEHSVILAEHSVLLTELRHSTHRNGLLLENLADKVQLILEIVQATRAEKLDKTEFETKYENHEVRIYAIETSVRAKNQN